MERPRVGLDLEDLEGPHDLERDRSGHIWTLVPKVVHYGGYIEERGPDPDGVEYRQEEARFESAPRGLKRSDKGRRRPVWPVQLNWCASRGHQAAVSIGSLEEHEHQLFPLEGGPIGSDRRHDQGDRRHVEQIGYSGRRRVVVSERVRDVGSANEEGVLHGCGAQRRVGWNEPLRRPVVRRRVEVARDQRQVLDGEWGASKGDVHRDRSEVRVAEERGVGIAHLEPHLGDCRSVELVVRRPLTGDRDG